MTTSDQNETAGIEVEDLGEASCSRCAYYNEVEPANFDAPDAELGIFPGRGVCMYYPPKIVFDMGTGKKESIRPIVEGIDWCGFFELVNDERGEKNE